MCFFLQLDSHGEPVIIRKWSVWHWMDFSWMKTRKSSGKARAGGSGKEKKNNLGFSILFA